MTVYFIDSQGRSTRGGGGGGGGEVVRSVP